MPAWATAGQVAVRSVAGEGTRLVEVHDGGRWCEGPAQGRRTRTLGFSDVRADRLMRLGPGGATRVRDPSSFVYGNGIARRGRLITCEPLGRRLVRQEVDGRLTVLADRYRNIALLHPTTSR